MNWALIGQIGTVIATILGAIKIWKVLNEKNHRVTMIVHSTHDPAPPLAYYLSEVIGERLSHSVLMAADATSVNLTSNGEGRSASDLRNDFTQALLARIPLDARSDRIAHLIRVTLENRGKKTAKSITIDYDFEPLFFQPSIEDARLDRRSVRLAELRPGQKLTLDFWVGPLTFHRDVRATHEDHVISQTRSYSLSGWRAALARHFFEPYVLLPCFLIALIVVLLTN